MRIGLYEDRPEEGEGSVYVWYVRLLIVLYDMPIHIAMAS